MSTNIKTLNDEAQSTEVTEDDDEWYTDIGTDEEKEVIEESEPYFFIN